MGVLEVRSMDDDCLADIDEIDAMDEEARKKPWNGDIVWGHVLAHFFLHMGTIYGIYLAFTHAMWQTNLWLLVMYYYGGLAITGGAHRLWTHRAFKANFWVRVFYMLGTCMAAQNDVIEWSRDHRCHHKWVDSDADPYNIKRSFFFAHMGWIWTRKHPKVIEMGKKIDMSDLEADPVLRFQRRFFVPLVTGTIVFLTAVPIFVWGEEVACAFYVGAVVRMTSQLHGTWVINSFAHMYGYRPFNTQITARDNLFFSFVAMGEAWHNYHHTFPQDYRVSEYPYKANTCTMLIDVFAYFGWTWDRKVMTAEAIENQKEKFGDHSRSIVRALDQTCHRPDTQ